MKYYILGPSCSGKTTLATILSNAVNTKHIQLDHIFFDFSESKKGKIKLPIEEIERRIKKTLENKNWIIEGIQQVPEVFKSAERIIYLRPKISTCVIYQWKRYFTDSNQRQKYGFISNLKLTISIVRQFLEPTTVSQLKNIRYSRISKSDIYYDKFTNNTIVITNRNSYLAFLKDEIKLSR